MSMMYFCAGLVMGMLLGLIIMDLIRADKR